MRSTMTMVVVSLLVTTAGGPAAVQVSGTTGAENNDAVSGVVQPFSNEARPVEDALQTVESLDSSLLLPPVNIDTSELVDVETRIGEGAVEVSSEPEDGVQIADRDGESLRVSIPLSDEVDDAIALADGVIAFPGQDSSTAVIVSDSGVQMLTTIENESAPARYEYHVDLEPGQKLEIVDNDVVILNSDGSLELAVAPAWAVDADGAAVPTSYEVDGTVLTQVVDHANTGAAYPVVADPIWIAPWVFRCLLGLGLSGPQITAAFASGTIWGGLGRAALACVTGK